MKTAILLLIGISTLVSACRKQAFSVNDCDALKTALVAQDKVAVSAQVKGMLHKYTRTNVDRFAKALPECGINVKNVCFSCIKTLPEQTSIHLEFNSSGALVQRELDISYNRDDNQMIVSGVHE